MVNNLFNLLSLLNPKSASLLLAADFVYIYIYRERGRDCWETVLQPQATVIVGTAVTKTMVSVFLRAAAANSTERNTSLLLNFVSNGDVKADRNGAKLPNLNFVFVGIHHTHHMSTLCCRQTHLYLFLQAGVGSAHIWMPAWGPDCAFLRRSWSQWGSCHCS